MSAKQLLLYPVPPFTTLTNLIYAESDGYTRVFLEGYATLIVEIGENEYECYPQRCQCRV